jgi:stalled ribosome rescue protein Dom34
MNGKLGIWIDHKQATIVSVAREHSLVTRVRSALRPHAHYHGAQDGGGEKKYEARHEQQVKHFVDAVARHIERGDDVLVLGPGETKSALVRRIRQIKSLSGVTTTTRSADRLTEAQLVATVRKRYHLPL